MAEAGNIENWKVVGSRMAKKVDMLMQEEEKGDYN